MIGPGSKATRSEDVSGADGAGGAAAFDSVLAAAQRGAEWALAALYTELRGPVYSYLRAGSAQEAEDLTSEVFVAVVAGLNRFDGDAAALRSWVFTIAHHRLTDHHRRTARQRTRPVPVEEFATRTDHADTEADAIGALGADSALRRIAQLPSAQAQVLFLRVVADLSVDQVAEIVGRRPGAVRALQFRALRQLRKELAAERP